VGIEVTTYHERELASVSAAILLRAYQHEAIARLRAALRHCRRVLLVAPTGAGKTVVASALIHSAHGRERRVLFFAHRRELIVQTYRKLLEAGIPEDEIGILMADDPRTRPAAPIQIASIDTYRHREPPAADLVIIDEAHRSLAKSYLDAIAHYSELGAVILGMTATPFRADGGGLGDVYESLEVVTTPRTLISEGYLVEPRVFSAPPDAMPDLEGVHSRRGDYVVAELDTRVNQRALVGGIVEHWLKHACGQRTVVFAVSVAHSRACTEAFTQAGIPAEHLDGETPTPERDAILARLQAGETLVVCNCGVLAEGWDMPAVKCAILARPTQSLGLYLQQAGRILRPWNGVRAVILDHAGNAIQHGLPQDDREFSLERSKLADAGSAPTKVCPECHAVIALGVRECPECGAAFPAPPAPPEEASRELVELDAAEQQRRRAAMRETWADLIASWHATNRIRVARGQRPYKPGTVYHEFVKRCGCRPPAGFELPPEIATEREKADAFSQLRAKARERGYRPGWAAYQFRRRFGHWPVDREVAA
jgi:superfamily II DNA or RNA helicase